MGLGAALSQLGNMYLQRNFQQKDAQNAEALRQKQRAEDEQIWRERQAYMARLQAPQERVRQVYDEQLKNAVAVREQWQPPDDGSQGPPAQGRWVEQGRDAMPPKPGELKTFRQGDEEVTALLDPQTGATIREVGRGNAFNPKQRGQGGGTAGTGTQAGGSTKGAPSGYRWSADGALEPIPGGPAAAKAAAADDIKLNSGDRKNIATTRQKLGTLDAIENQLNNVEALFEPLKGSWSAGGGGQGRIPTESGKKFDAAVAQLSPLMRQLTRVPGEGAVSDYETRLLENASLNRGDYESTTAEKLKAARELVAEMRKAHAMSLDTYGLGPDGKPAGEKTDTGKSAGSSRQNPVPITSEAEADSLPAGTWVVLNGRVGQT